MGRPYSTELDELDQTYRWALEASIDALAETFAAGAQSSLLTVGSGGSLTAAHFAAHLHTKLTGKIAQVTTPYELISSTLSLENSTVLVLSAGGSNPDVLACVREVANRQPENLAAITTRTDSPLGDQLRELAWPSIFEFDAPIRKDGFLATNSLLATVILMARAYAKALEIPLLLPATLDVMLHPNVGWRDFVESLEQQISPLLQRATLVVLHGWDTRAAAADIESRFTEAALGSVQVADFRNFAHGRHHWLAVNSATSAILALASPQDRQVASRTLSLIPKEIPRLLLNVDGSIQGSVTAICQSIYLAFIAGKHKGIDPGRPHVPQFGRKLYHLNAMPRFKTRQGMSERVKSAVERKTGLSCRTLSDRGELNLWIEYHRQFVERLGNSQMEAIIFDYDGTLCGPHRRFEGPTDSIIEKLTEFLKAGLFVGIATGRGKSVREDLYKRIRSSAHRKRLSIAYHNGAEIGTLDDASIPPETALLSESLKPIEERLRLEPQVARNSKITAKGSQITVQLPTRAETSCMLEAISRIARDLAPPGVVVVCSTHSIDVLSPGISKLRLLEHFQQSLGTDESRVLCIGDRGRWPGNDADLLHHPLSLSVDQVSRDPLTCWNLSPPGLRYDNACLDYLDRLVVRKKTASFSIEELF